MTEQNDELQLEQKTTEIKMKINDNEKLSRMKTSKTKPTWSLSKHVGRISLHISTQTRTLEQHIQK